MADSIATTTATAAVYENVYYKKAPVAEREPPKNLLKGTQKQVDELVEILHDNVDKAMERDHKLSDLKAISKSLEKGADEFKTQAIVVKRQEWRKRMKTKLVCAGLLAVLIIIIILFGIQIFSFK